MKRQSSVSVLCALGVALALPGGANAAKLLQSPVFINSTAPGWMLDGSVPTGANNYTVADASHDYSLLTAANPNAVIPWAAATYSNGGSIANYVQGQTGADATNATTAHIAGYYAVNNAGMPADTEGSGWLRLTSNKVNLTGSARYAGAAGYPNSFSAKQGIAIDFDYVMWGKGGNNNWVNNNQASGDGISVYLYDSSSASPMLGAAYGGSLGYCGAAGVYLGVGFDSFGNFSRNGTNSGCTSATDPDPGARQPNRIVVRGPSSSVIATEGGSGTPYQIGGFYTLPSGTTFSNRNATLRSEATIRNARIVLMPANATATVYSVSVYDGVKGSALSQAISNVMINVPAPASMSLGFAASTGNSAQFHEVRLNSVTTLVNLAVSKSMTSPAEATPAPTVQVGSTVSYAITLKNQPTQPSGTTGIPMLLASDTPTITDSLSQLVKKTWTCVATGDSTTCPTATSSASSPSTDTSSSGTGDIAGLSGYTIGGSGSLTFTLTGQVGASACSQTFQNTATIKFPDSSGYANMSSNSALSGNLTVSGSHCLQAQDDTASTPAGTPVTTNVQTNDSPLGATGSVNVSVPTTGAPSNGTVTVNTDGTITYTPNPSFTGTDTYTYQVCDSASPPVCDTATVTVSVTPTSASSGTVANDDTANTNMNTPVSMPLLANDTATGVALNPNSVAVTVAPKHGTVSFDPSTGLATYTPAPGFTGTDPYTYQVCNTATPAVCDTAVATVLVGQTAAATPTITSTPDSTSTPQNTPVTLNVLGNDSAIATVIDPTSLTVTQPANGKVTVDPVTSAVTYTPNKDYAGTDTFTYTVCNADKSLCGTTTVTVTVTVVAPTPQATAVPLWGPLGTTITSLLLGVALLRRRSQTKR